MQKSSFTSGNFKLQKAATCSVSSSNVKCRRNAQGVCYNADAQILVLRGSDSLDLGSAQGSEPWLGAAGHSEKQHQPLFNKHQIRAAGELSFLQHLPTGKPSHTSHSTILLLGKNSKGMLWNHLHSLAPRPPSSPWNLQLKQEQSFLTQIRDDFYLALI